MGRPSDGDALERGRDDDDRLDPARAMAAGYRIDPLDGAPAWIVPDRQARPMLPSGACPFCPGGSAAPADYDVHSFVNHWPPLPDGRAEVLLHSPEHDASFATFTPERARRVVDLWADRTAALGARADVDYVLVFENRGPEVGATIAHPHGQLYAFDLVPPAVLAEYAASTSDAFAAPPELVVSRRGSWSAWISPAPQWPYQMVLAPDDEVPDLPSLDDAGRDDLGRLLIDVYGRLDAHFGETTPTMSWIHQRPFDGVTRPSLRTHVHLAPIRRAPGTTRFVAAGELGSGVWFDPVDPARAAADLRSAITDPDPR